MPIFTGGEAISSEEYVGNGRVTEFRYGKYLGEAFRGNNQLKYLNNFGEGWGMMHRANSLVFIDNHDNQRGHGAGGDMILTFRVPKWYKVRASRKLTLRLRANISYATRSHASLFRSLFQKDLLITG